jgi:hypothetical protein
MCDADFAVLNFRNASQRWDGTQAARALTEKERWRVPRWTMSWAGPRSETRNAVLDVDGAKQRGIDIDQWRRR